MEPDARQMLNQELLKGLVRHGRRSWTWTGNDGMEAEESPSISTPQGADGQPRNPDSSPITSGVMQPSMVPKDPPSSSEEVVAVHVGRRRRHSHSMLQPNIDIPSISLGLKGDKSENLQQGAHLGKEQSTQTFPAIRTDVCTDRLTHLPLSVQMFVKRPSLVLIQARLTKSQKEWGCFDHRRSRPK